MKNWVDIQINRLRKKYVGNWNSKTTEELSLINLYFGLYFRFGLLCLEIMDAELGQLSYDIWIIFTPYQKYQDFFRFTSDEYKDLKKHAW